MILGEHEDGRWLMYIGSSLGLPKRIAAHIECIARIREGEKDSSIQDIHRILGRPGWSEFYHVILDFFAIHLAELEITKFACETILMLLFRSLDQNYIGQYGATATKLLRDAPPTCLYTYHSFEP